MNEIIESTANPIVRTFKDLHRSKVRRRLSQTIVEGPKVLSEFLEAGFVPQSVLALESDERAVAMCSERNVAITFVSERALHAAAGTVTTPGPLAVIRIPESQSARLHNTLVLVDISDPGNVGTMIRTAAAFDWDVACTGSTADPWSPKTLRSGAGAHVHTRLVRMQDPLSDIDAAGLTPIATVVSDGKPAQPRSAPVALLIGSESHGLPAWAIARGIERISIPMPGGTESLNAAIAAGITMHALM